MIEGQFTVKFVELREKTSEEKENEHQNKKIKNGDNI